jgi:hypothetical protein
MTNEQSVIGKRRTSAQIEQIVHEFKSSGLNITQFCQQQGLRQGALYRYLKRLGRENVLLAVEVAGQPPIGGHAGSCGLSVVLANGRRIAVSAVFDAATLQRLVQVLEAM